MTGCCYDNNNKLVLLCYLSIIFVIAHYGDPGLPRWIKVCAFGIFYDPPFFYYQCVFILVFIGDQAISFVKILMLWPAMNYVLCSGCTAHTYVCSFKIEWYHLIVQAGFRCVFKNNNTIQFATIL